MDLFSLRQKHPQFDYRSFQAKRIENDVLLSFDFHLKADIDFQAKLKLKNLSSAIAEKVEKHQEDKTLNNLLHHLGLAEIPSYWKAACSPVIGIEETHLSEKQIDFWHDLLIKGMGEFYHQNDIDFTQEDFLKIEAKNATQEKGFDQKSSPNTKLEDKKLLVPVGGGKDSATVLGILERKKLDYDILLLAPHSPAAKEIATLLKEKGHCQNIIEAERTIDAKLIELNQAGYLNGHTPFSAYLAFLTVTIAYLFGHDLILLANEASADEENTIFHGQKVNHQYSKSSEFEQKFQKYSQNFLFAESDEKPHYFSYLRPLSELEITKTLIELAKEDDNFKIILRKFRSCNVGQQKGIWCHDCPKCAFVYLMLSAHLDPEIVSQEIFNENLFEKESLKETFHDLLGFGDKKPFECVGTFAESKKAALLAETRYNEKKLESPPLLKELVKKIKAGK